MSDDSSRRDQINLLRGLRAVRDYRPDPVPTAVLDDLLDVARWTGSAKNLQPWDLIVVRERATLDRLAAMQGYVEHLATAPLGIVLVMAGDNPEFATYDEGRLAERLMLAAAVHGLGSSIGWWSGTARHEAQTLLGAPPESIVRTIVAFDYPALGQQPIADEIRAERPKGYQARKPIESIVQQERYGGVLSPES